MTIVGDLADARPLGKHTLENYRRACVYYQNFVGRDVDVGELNPRSVNQWLTSEESRYDAQYVRSLRRDLLVVWNYAADAGLCDHPKSRLIRISKVEDKAPTSWPLEWVPRLLIAAARVEGYVRKIRIPRSVYAEAYLRVQLDLLCRPTDMRHLMWNSIKDGYIEWIQHKTGKRHRMRIQAATARALEALRGYDDKYVFPMGKTSTEILIHKIFEIAGIKKPKKQSLGHLRHTGGTAIATKSGCDAARHALGHTASSRVFEAHYLDATKVVQQGTTSWWE